MPSNETTSLICVVHVQMLGVAKGCLESVLPYIHDRMAFGQPIADFQVQEYMYPCVIHSRHSAVWLYHVLGYAAPEGPAGY